MINTLITRISYLDQYNKTKKTIIWEDKTSNRWDKVYSKLKIGDNAIFISKDITYIGNISRINSTTIIQVEDIKELYIKNDEFLQLDEIYPELISRVKANFQPFIHEKEINIQKLIEDVNNKNFISYYIFSSITDYENRNIELNEKDRVTILNNGVIENIQVYSNQKLYIAPFNKLLNSSGKTLKQLLKITEKYKGEDSNSNNVKRLKDIQNELKREKYYKFKTFFSYHDTLYNSRIYGVRTNIEDIIEKINDKNITNLDMPLNQILYGPPGTGKTYTLKKDYFPKYTLKETSITKELFFEETVRSLTWWQVIALALLENGTSRVNDILTNRWVALKSALSESKNVRATLWGTLQMHTIQESETVAYTQRQTPLIFDKKEDKSWMLLEDELKEQSPELYEVLDSVNNFKANPQKEIKHYVFTTFHQSFSYEDFIEGIKPKMEDETETDKLTYKIEPGIFKELCSRAQSDPANRYAIFIDEINRGNVSQIFGELITLIETDKRLGAVNEMKVKLPYSKKEFGVPSNVDIYGTMNTADRSVEALDTALRRRFSFKELMPNSKVIEEKGFSDYLRKEIMEKINNRIELLLDRNHTLGHAYFIKENFENSFENEIIPLLQEYFYNDYGKIGLVLGKGFVREKSISTTRDKTIFADFETKNEVDIVKSYELIPFDKVDFKTAIATLLA